MCFDGLARGLYTVIVIQLNINEHIISLERISLQPNENANNNIKKANNSSSGNNNARPYRDRNEAVKKSYHNNMSCLEIVKSANIF